jgi:hypothetical protein
MCRSARTRRTAARVAGAFALTLVAAGVLASAASAASSITVSPSSAPRGSTVTISGNVPVSGTASCASGDPAQLTSTADLFPPDGLGPQAPRDAIGNFDITYTIPPAASSGAHSIGVRCGGGAVGVSATLQVTQTPTTTGVAPTTTSSTSTTVATAQTTTAPRATTTTPRAAPASKSSSRAVWIVLGALALLLAAGAALLFFRRRKAAGSH